MSAPTLTPRSDKFHTTDNVASGTELFYLVSSTTYSAPTGWTKVRYGNSWSLFKRTANGTSTDDFNSTSGGVGFSFPNGTTENYTSGTWDTANSTPSSAPAPNGGSALSGSDDCLVVVWSARAYANFLGNSPYAPDLSVPSVNITYKPAITSGFTGVVVSDVWDDLGSYDDGTNFEYDTSPHTQGYEYKALTTSTPGATTFASNPAKPADGYDWYVDSYSYSGAWSYATLAFKAASSGTAYTASASGTATATGTASLTKSLTGSATGTETATGTGAITYTANSTASSSITASGTAAGTKTVSIDATSTITSTGTAAASTTSPVSITATSSITATGTSAATSTQALAGSGTVTASGLADLTLRPLQTATASSSVTASGTAASTVTYSATASSSITATGIAVLSQSLKASASSTITGTATGAVGTLATASTVTAVASSPSVARINPNETRVSRA